ncbi:MAG: DUF4339 domain-containing protein [Planctomycetota bacterium]
MELAFQFVVWAVFGAIVAVIAQSRGRTPVGWFFIGLAAPCIGLILVIVLPDLKREQAQKERLRRENQRLRERARKDRQVADQRHAATIKRLGAHDAVLGLDTRAAEEAPPQLPSHPPSSDPTDDDAPRIDPESRWHYAATEDSGSEGPISFRALRALWESGDIGPDSLVWSKGMEDWIAIGDDSTLEEELRRG